MTFDRAGFQVACLELKAAARAAFPLIAFLVFAVCLSVTAVAVLVWLATS